MTDFRMRYETRKSRSGWAEWGPFILAVMAGAGLLFMLARQSPILSGPDPLPASHSPHPSAGHGDATSQQPSADHPQ
jgi:hypothetical protein